LDGASTSHERAATTQLGTTIRHVGIAGSNPLAPTIPNNSRKRSRNRIGEAMGGGFRGQLEPHRLETGRIDPAEQRARKLSSARPAIGKAPGFTEAL
jgi:hypothetical protein